MSRVVLCSDGLYDNKEKITESLDLMWHWNSCLEIAPDVTFGNLIDYLISEDLIQLSVGCLTQINIGRFKEEYLKEYEPSNNIKHIEIVKWPYLQGNLLVDYPHCNGVFREPLVNKGLGTTDYHCGLGLTAWNCLKELPIVLNTEVQGDLVPKGTDTFFSLGEVLTCLFDELGFHGSPDCRDERADSLRDAVKGVEDGTIKTIPLDEVMNRIKEKLEENDVT